MKDPILLASEVSSSNPQTSHYPLQLSTGSQQLLVARHKKIESPESPHLKTPSEVTVGAHNGLPFMIIASCDSPHSAHLLREFSERVTYLIPFFVQNLMREQEWPIGGVMENVCERESALFIERLRKSTFGYSLESITFCVLAVYRPLECVDVLKLAGFRIGDMLILLENLDKRRELSRHIVKQDLSNYGSFFKTSVTSGDKIIVVCNLPQSMKATHASVQLGGENVGINPILDSRFLANKAPTQAAFFEELSREIQVSPPPHCRIAELVVPSKPFEEMLCQTQSGVQLPFYAKNLSRSTNELFHFIRGNHELLSKGLPFGEFGLLDLTLLPLVSIPLLYCAVGSVKATTSIFDCSVFLAPIALIPLALFVVFGLLLCVNESLRFIAAVALTLILSVPRAICRAAFLCWDITLFPAEAAGFFKPVVVAPR